MSQIRAASGFTGPGQNATLSITDPRLGGVGNGVTDNGPSGRNVFAKAAALLGSAGGELYVPPGVFNFTSQPAALPSNIRLRGAGKNVSILQKSFTGEGLIRFEGSSTTSRCQRGGLADLQVKGNGFTGTLITGLYADHLNFDRVWVFGNQGHGVKFTEVWDTYFNGCEFEQLNGADGFTPAILLQSSATDSTNNIWFDQCRWESFKDGALWIATGGVGSAYNPSTGSKPCYGVYLTQCKMETFTARGSFINYSADVLDVHVDMMEMAAIGLDSGASAINMVNFIPFNFCSFTNVRVLVSANAVNNVFYIFAGPNGHSIQDINVDATTALGGAIIAWGGGNQYLDIQNVMYRGGQTGTIYGGTVPSNVRLIDQETPNLLGSHRGYFLGQTAYKINDTVTYFGNLYQCRLNHTSASTFANTNWNFLSRVQPINMFGTTAPWILPDTATGPSTSSAFSQNVASGVRFVMPCNGFISDFGVNVTAAGTSGSVLRFALYTQSVDGSLNLVQVIASEIANGTSTGFKSVTGQNTTPFSIGQSVIIAVVAKTAAAGTLTRSTGTDPGLQVANASTAGVTVLGGGAGFTWTDGSSSGVVSSVSSPTLSASPIRIVVKVTPT